MLLAIDIGNTNIKTGIFDGDSLIKSCKLISSKNLHENQFENALRELIRDYDIDTCVIASVVNEVTAIVKKVSDDVLKLNSVVINNESDFGLKINVKNPNEPGIDRLANANAAKNNYPLPAIIVDAGTAITFDIISAEGEFIGGLIMPGLDLQFNSLSKNTSQLPELSIEKFNNVIGGSTKEAILSGVVCGTAYAIEGLINKCENELGEKAVLIATGGQIDVISQYMSRKFDYNVPELTLEGLKILYNLNMAK